MRCGDHRITGTEEHDLLIFGKFKKVVGVLLHILAEEAVHRFPVIFFHLLNGRSHEAGCITFQKHMVCLPDTGKALFRDVRFIKQPEADKGQHGGSL